MFRRPSFLFIITLISLIFFALIAFDFSPYLRGPALYPPDWRWPYQPTNTLRRIWFPMGVILVVLFVFNRSERSKNLDTFKTLILFVVLGFLLQISFLYYSRSGIEVLIHRTINPMISGYFTISTQIVSLSDFIRNFNQSIYDYPMYARFHPPGGILFYYFLELFLRSFTPIFTSILSTTPSHSDVAFIWTGLNELQKFNAIVSGFVIAFISSLAIIPTYLSSKILYGEKVAIRSAALIIFVPSVLLFAPLIDVFMPIFTSISLYLFLKGKITKNLLYFFLGGFTLFIGAFFTLTFIPFLGFFFLIILINLVQNRRDLLVAIKQYISFILGFVLVPFILFFAGLNLIETVQRIMFYHEAAQAGRGHLVWYFYNIYDFILFAGIPIGIIFVYIIIKSLKTIQKNKNIKKVDVIFLSFLITLTVVNFSGAVRAETARIWLPFIPILIIVVVNFTVFKLKFTHRQFTLLLLLQAIQVLIFQSVIVTVW